MSSEFEIHAYLAPSNAGIATVTPHIKPCHYTVFFLATDFLGCTSSYRRKTNKEESNPKIILWILYMGNHHLHITINHTW
jgi:hypothetical protein